MKATIEVRPTRRIGTVDPLIYGQFLSRRRWVSDEGLHDPKHPDARKDGLRRGVVDAVAETAPTVVRWPGGCTGTSYEWQAGVGPQEERPRLIDAHFGYGVGNGFGTAEFVRFCREIGAEPHINLATGTRSLQEALAWVEYCNLDTDTRWANLRRTHGQNQPFGIKFWQIGNEEWGPWEIGYTTAADYAARAREWAKAIKKLSPAARVLALGGGDNGSMLDWTAGVVAEAGKYIDYVTQHRYWSFNSVTGDDAYDRMVSVGFREEHLIKALAGVIDLVAFEKNLPRKPKLAYTEWNCRDAKQEEMSVDWRPDSRPRYRLVDALACAGFLNALQRQCNVVGLANFAQTLNVVGMLVVTPEVVLRETVFHALAMQRRLSGDVAVEAAVECATHPVTPEGGIPATMPVLDVSATRDAASGRQFVSIINCSRSEPIETKVTLGDAAGSARTHQLWHADPFARNSAETPDAVAPKTATAAISGNAVSLSLPPHSYTILEVAP